MEQKPFTGDELRAIVTSGAGTKSPAPSAPAMAPGVKPEPMTGGELRGVIERSIEERKPKVGLGEDVLRAAGSGLGRGVVGLAGLPGDVEALGRMGLRKAGADVAAEPYLPTSQQTIGAVSGIHPSLRQAMEYKPETGPGRYAKSIGEFAPAMIGGPGSIAARTAGTVGAAAASQAAEDVLKGTSLEGTGYETAAKVAAAIPGGILGTKTAGLVSSPFSGVLTPGREAEKRIVGELGKDIAAGGKFGAKASPAEVASVGADVPVAAIAGKRTQDLIQRSAERVPENVHGQFAAGAQAFRDKAKGVVTQQIDDMFGGVPVKPFDEIAELSRQAAAVNTPAYKQLYALPHAQAVTSPELVQVIGRLPRGMLNDVGELLRQQGADPKSLGMVMGRGGSWTINPTQPMPIQFWDTLKRQLDVSVMKTKDPMTGKILDPGIHSASTGTVEKLKTALRPIVPEYDQVRGAAAEILGAKNAVELGTKFLSMTKQPEIDQIYRKVLNNPAVSDDVKRDFAYGVAGSYRQQLEDAPEAALKMFTGKDAPKKIRMMSDALAPIGPEAGPQLVGQIIAQNLNSGIQALRPGAGSKVGQIMPYAAPGLGTAALQIGEILAQPYLWATSGGALAPLLVGAAGGKYFNMKESRIAQKVLEYSMDPSKMQQLAQLAASDPNARSFIQKLTDLAQKYGRYTAAATIGTEPAPERMQRASGGRVDPQFHAEKLIRAAEEAKKAASAATEPLLEQPDEHIVKALDIAKRHI